MLFRAGWNASFSVDFWFYFCRVAWLQMNSHMSLLRVHHSGREQSRESLAPSSNNSEPNSHDVWHAKSKKKMIGLNFGKFTWMGWIFYPLDLAKDSIMSDLGNRLLKTMTTNLINVEKCRRTLAFSMVISSPYCLHFFNATIRRLMAARLLCLWHF